MSHSSIFAMDRNRCNSPRHDAESRDSSLSSGSGASPGHYESWFLRGNHPSRPLAFWIRYTIFHPRGGSPVGELWGIWFDGENHQIAAAKETIAWAFCSFANSRLDIAMGDARLRDGELSGRLNGSGNTLAWNLQYAGGDRPLLLLPQPLYAAPLPRAKALVPRPGARFSGSFVVNGVTHAIDKWPGSQNHNWGSRHTDRYAWGQVAGFDNAPDAFLECATAKLRIGPLWTPWLTTVVLRLDGQEYAINSMWRAARAKASISYFDWHFQTPPNKGAASGQASIECHIRAPRESFIGLTYGNPPGGSKTCLNSKLASCELTLTVPGQAPRKLHSAHRAAFEILTDDTDHGVPVVV